MVESSEVQKLFCLVFMQINLKLQLLPFVSCFPYGNTPLKYLHFTVVRPLKKLWNAPSRQFKGVSPLASGLFALLPLSLSHEILGFWGSCNGSITRVWEGRQVCDTVGTVTAACEVKWNLGEQMRCALLAMQFASKSACS